VGLIYIAAFPGLFARRAQSSGLGRQGRYSF
jgi:hypothetical protein